MWTGAKGENGYGNIWFDGKLRRATHVSCFPAHGIWTKADLMHVCDTPPCIRPEHLIEGDAASNNYDRMVKKLGGIVIP
jgi:hypothetical protein